MIAVQVPNTSRWQIHFNDLVPYQCLFSLLLVLFFMSAEFILDVTIAMSIPYRAKAGISCAKVIVLLNALIQK